MVLTRNISRSRANPPRMQDQQGNVDSRPPAGALETIHDNTNEMEALRLTNQHLIRELEQLTKQMQRLQEVRQTREGHNTTSQEEQPHLGPPREVEIEVESNRARGHEPYLPPQRGAQQSSTQGEYQKR